MNRPLHEIAKEIFSDIRSGKWSTNASHYALPYLRAMTELDTIDEPYYSDDGKSIVLYFLANASTWRGETARRIKAELKELAK